MTTNCRTTTDKKGLEPTKKIPISKMQSHDETVEGVLSQYNQIPHPLDGHLQTGKEFVKGVLPQSRVLSPMSHSRDRGSGIGGGTPRASDLEGRCSLSAIQG